MGYHYHYDYPHLYCGCTLTEQVNPDGFERHCHAMYELLYVVQGKGKCVVESAEYPMLPGTVLLLRPYEFHYVCPDRNCAYERIVLNFDGEGPTPYAAALSIMQKEQFRGNGVYFSFENVTDAVRAAFDEMRDVPTLFGKGVSNPAGEEELMRLLLSQVLLRLSALQPDLSAGEDEGTVARILSYLNRHLSEDLSLDALAQRFFVSKYHLCRAFRKHTGVSVMTYFNTKRIALAQRLLAEGEPATSVAMAVGFQNYSSFYRTYCKYVGHAPAHRRRGVGREEESNECLMEEDVT